VVVAHVSDELEQVPDAGHDGWHDDRRQSKRSPEFERETILVHEHLLGYRAATGLAETRALGRGDSVQSPSD
jgi:hypothetical protein